MSLGKNPAFFLLTGSILPRLSTSVLGARFGLTLTNKGSAQYQNGPYN